MTLGICIPTLVASGISAGITYAIASKQLKLPSYTIRFLDDDGTVLQTSKVQIGSDAVYSGKTPTKSNPEEWVDYEWTGWDSSLKNIIADKDFKPTFNSSHQTYTMTWYDSDGTVLKTETINKGVEPIYGPTNPTKKPSEGKQYIFKKWNFEGDWKTGSYSATAVYNEAMEGLTITNGCVESFGGTGEVEVPAEWENIPVTTIKANAFQTTEATKVTKVKLPNTITTLEPYAFSSATELTNVQFPDNESIQSIGEHLFSGCTSLQSITIPDSVKTIEDYAFEGCTKLSSLALGANVIDFKPSAFNNCPALETITIDSSNPRFKTVEGCDGMIFGQDDGVIDVLIRCLPSVKTVESSKLPTTLKIIVNNAFQGCTNISTIDFSNCNVVEIGDYAFQGSSIKSFKSGNNIVSFGTNVFQNCQNLESVELGSNVDPDQMKWDSLLGCPKLTQIIVDSFNTKMGTDTNKNIVYAKENGSLKSVLRCLPTTVTPTIAASVTKIGEYAFNGCKNITNINFLSGINEICNNAFNNCTSVTEADLGNDVTKIGASIFSNCSSLSTIKVGTGLEFDYNEEHINFQALDGCTNLKKIEVDSNNQSLKSDTNGILYGHALNDTVNWLIKYPPLIQNTEFTIPNDVNGIGKYAFRGAKNLTKVTMPTSIVAGVWDYAFQDCSNLVQMEFEGNASKITFQSNAFTNCTKLNTIVISSITDSSTFAESLKTLIDALTPGKVTPINVILNIDTWPTSLNPILYKNYIRSLQINGGVTSIPENAFNDCYTIESVEMDNQITSIEKNAFITCRGLSNITFSTSLLSIGEYAFQGDQQLSLMTFPDSLTSIAGHAFESCVGVYFNSLPSSLKTIGEYSFTNNTTATSLNTNKVETIGAGAFANWSKLETLTLTNSIKSIGRNAFGDCVSLSETINFDGTEAEWKAISHTGNPFSGTPVKKVKLKDGTIIAYDWN